MAAETRRARRVVLHGMYVQNTTLRYSRMFDKDLLPPSATASHSSGRRRRRAHPHCHLSSVQRTEYSTQQSQYRGTRYRGFPGHEGRQTRHFSAKSESFSLGRAQQLSVCGLRRRRRVRRIRRRALCSLGMCRAAETQGQIGDVLVARTNLLGRAGQLMGENGTMSMVSQARSLARTLSPSS